MTEARLNQIAAAFGTNEEKIREIGSKNLDEALEYFNAQGYDFTDQELAEFSDELKKTAGTSELSEGTLEKVSGGFVILAGIAGALAMTNLAIGVAAWGLDYTSKRRYGGR